MKVVTFSPLPGQGAELMGKYGINVPKGVAVSSAEEIRKAIQSVFPSEKEVYLLSNDTSVFDVHEILLKPETVF